MLLAEYAAQPAVLLLQGPEVVLQHEGILGELADRCGQTGAMNWMGYFLSGLGRHWKRPCLVLFVRPGSEIATLCANDLLAAALYFELRVLGVGSGAFSTDSIDGLRTVVAPPGLHSQIAALATEELMRRGAHVVMTTYPHPMSDKPAASAMLQSEDVMCAELSRIVKTSMSLEPTYEATLAKLGKHTRTNLRYYRKRFAAKTECEFFGDIRNMVTMEEVLAVNALALNRETRAECIRRHRAACDLPEGFLCGLRSANGQWLSLIGGWRQGSTTILQFQSNVSGYEKDSLSTVMRSYYLEHESERGTRRLVMYRGTRHSMGNSFDQDQVRDLVTRRRTARAWVLVRLARLLVSNRGGTTTFFFRTLTNRALHWSSVTARERTAVTSFAIAEPGALHDADSRA